MNRLMLLRPTHPIGIPSCSRECYMFPVSLGDQDLWCTVNRSLRSLGLVFCVGFGGVLLTEVGAAPPPALQSPNRFDRIGPAGIIVIAEPLPSKTESGATIYHVLEVLFGKQRIGGAERIDVDDYGIWRDTTPWLERYVLNRPQAKIPPPKITKVVLFLNRDVEYPHRYQPQWPGMFALDEKGNVFEATSTFRHGSYELSAWNGMTWEKFLVELRRNVPRHELDVVSHLNELYSDISPRGPTLGRLPRASESRFLDFEAPDPYADYGLPRTYTPRRKAGG
jgi:hypothetical protein